MKSFVGSSRMTCTCKIAVPAVLVVLACLSLAFAQTTQPAATAPSPATQPLSLDQLAQQGADALAAGDAATAIKAFTTISQAQPNNTSALLGLAEAYLKGNNPLKAVEMYNSCRKISPGDWRADYGLGTVYLQMNYFRLAKPFLERALQLSPNQPQARGRVATNLALCYRGLHQTTEALDMARRALALDPTAIEVHRLLIALYVDANRVDDALAEVQATTDSLRATLVKTPDDRPKSEQLLQILSMRVDLLKAKIAAQPDDPVIRLQMADAMEQVSLANQQATYQLALEQVDVALQKVPQDPDVLFAHGRLANLIGRPAKAIEDLQALLKIAPNDARAKQLLEKIEAASTQPAEK
jgi:tetratricopeptide (TPR) repeat protein